MKKQIKRISLLLLTAAFIFVSVFTDKSYAWFTDTNVTQKIFQIGDIVYIYSGTLVTDPTKKYVPGEELLTSGNLTLTNKSTITTNFRVKILYSFTDIATDPDTVYTNEPYGPGCALEDYLTIGLVSKWKYDVTDDCYHYEYDTGDYVLPIPPVEGYTFEIINTITFDGENIKNSYSGQGFGIKILFQAKQSEFVGWTTFFEDELNALV